MIGKGLLRALASIQPSDVWLPYKTINKRSLRTWKGGWCLHHPFKKIPASNDHSNQAAIAPENRIPISKTIKAMIAPHTG